MLTTLKMRNEYSPSVKRITSGRQSAGSSRIATMQTVICQRKSYKLILTMKDNDRKTYYVLLTFIGLALWIAETAYFGFHDKPQSGIEKMLDTISWVFILWGIIGNIVKTALSGVEYHKHEGDLNFPNATKVEMNN